MLVKLKSGELDSSTLHIIQNRKRKKNTISLNDPFLLASPILSIIPNRSRRWKSKTMHFIRMVWLFV